MTNAKTITQDILNLVLVFALVGMGLNAQLQPLISPTLYHWIMLAIAGALLLVYNADVIFGFSNTNVPIPPTQPVTTPAVVAPPTTPAV